MTRKLTIWFVTGLMTLGFAMAQQGMGRRGNGNGLGQGPRDGTGYGIKAGQRGANCGKDCVCDGTGRGARQQSGQRGPTQQRGRRR